MMRALPWLLLVLAPATALADQYPFVAKGPVVSGVTRNEAWVAWATAHHQGDGWTCTVDSWTGSPNKDIPTVRISPAGDDGDTFQDPDCSREHKVLLTGLRPGTRYDVVLDKPWDKGGGTAIASFRTAPADDLPFSFVVYGDNRDEPWGRTSTRADHQSVVDAIVRDEPDAAFLVSTGDFALNIPAVSGDDRGYKAFFEVERALLSSRPFFAVIGNHEKLDTGDFDALVSARHMGKWPHPYYWSMDWGRAHIAFVDAFEGPASLGGLGGYDPGVKDDQIRWLDQDLQAARDEGRILFLVSHQSPYSHSDDSSAHGGSPDVQSKVVPLMLKHGVVGVFAGHDHYYQRGNEGCIDYFVVGGGGAPMYDPDPAAPGVAVALKQLSYMVVNVDGTRASAVTRSASGSVLDTFDFRVPDGTACGVPPPGGSPDAGGAPDAGTPADAGFASDAGAPPPASDAGAGEPARDAGGEPSVVADAGPVAGEEPGDATYATAGGCACTSAGTAGAVLLGACLAVLRKRRRTGRGRGR